MVSHESKEPIIELDIAQKACLPLDKIIKWLEKAKKTLLECFRIITYNSPGEKDRIAEVYFDNFKFCEIYINNNKKMLKFFTYPNKQNWKFDLDFVMYNFERSKNRFLDIY